MKKTIICLLVSGIIIVTSSLQVKANLIKKELITKDILVVKEISRFDLISTKLEEYEYKEITLTLDQRIEDYEYFWNVLENNFPLLNLAKKNGVDIEELKNEYYIKIQENASIEENATMYIELISKIKNNDFLGHLGLVTHYEYFRNILEPTYEEVYDAYNPEKINMYYFNLMKSDGNLSKYFGNKAEMRKSFDYEIDSENSTAYLKIYSMNNSGFEDELISFYEEIANYDKLVIDIMSNGGGLLHYWLKNVVEPNIDEVLTIQTNIPIMGGVENISWLENFTNIASYIEMKDIKDIKFMNMDGISKNDIELFDYYWDYEMLAVPMYEEKLFKGDIYLLINEKTYSSSSLFAKFSKETGFATLIGRNDGGDCFGMQNHVELPNSRFIIKYAPFYSINADGSSNEEFGTTPDIIVPDDKDILEFAQKYLDFN